MTEKEFQYLNKLSAFSNLTGGEVIRELVFKRRLLQPKVPLLDQQAYLELKRIGNNVNQIAKHLNSGATDKIPADVLGRLSGQLDIILRKVVHAG